MRDEFIKTLTDLARKDDRIVLITGDLGFGVLTQFEKEFPQQYINAGVAEQNMTGLATGLALEGYKVFTYSIGNFCTLRCLEQIRNDAAYHDANVNVVSIGGGFSYGALGFSHHATEDLSIMRSLPNVLPTSPSCLWEVSEVTKAIVAKPGVSYLRLDKSHPGNTRKAKEVFEFGKIRCLREGNDIALVTSGGILEEVLAAADELSEKGIQARVLSVHCLRPLDHDALKRAAVETRAMISVEENSVFGGLGSAIAEVLLEEAAIPSSFFRLGLRDGFSTAVGSQKYLRNLYGMGKEAIVSKSIEILGSSRPRSQATTNLSLNA